MSSLQDRGRHRKVQALPLSRMARSQAGDSGALLKVGAKSENVEERMEVAKKYSRASFQRNKGHFSLKKWESEKHKSWRMPGEGFRGPCGHRRPGKWGACGWAVVQLDYDGEMGPLRGMYGLVEAVFEVQRTIKRAELTAFLCLLKKVIGPVRVHVDNKGIIDGLRRGERKCIKPRAGDADLCLKNWEKLRGLTERGMLVEAEHVQAHRRKKERKHVSQFERFVTEGNEKAGDLAKAGAMVDEGFMAEARAETMQKARERGCMQHRSMRPASTAW